MCRITCDLMRDPVCLSSGFTYEREAILKHFSVNGYTDPMTRQKICPDIIIENRELKNAIEDFLLKNPWAYKHVRGQTSDKM